MSQTESRLPRKLAKAAEVARRRVQQPDTATAVLLVESYHRPPWRRIMEYAYWAALRVRPNLLSSEITLGLCQARAEHITEYLRRKGHEATFWRVVLAGETVHSAVEITAHVLANRRDAECVSEAYTGRKNHYYDKLVSEVRKILAPRATLQ